MWPHIIYLQLLVNPVTFWHTSLFFSPFPFSVPSAPSNVEGLCTTIVWSEPSQTNGVLTGYDLRFYSNDREKIVSNRSDENFRIVKETDKPSGSENIFVQVRAYISYRKHYLQIK